MTYRPICVVHVVLHSNHNKERCQMHCGQNDSIPVTAKGRGHPGARAYCHICLLPLGHVGGCEFIRTCARDSWNPQ